MSKEVPEGYEGIQFMVEPQSPMYPLWPHSKDVDFGRKVLGQSAVPGGEVRNNYNWVTTNGADESNTAIFEEPNRDEAFYEAALARASLVELSSEAACVQKQQKIAERGIALAEELERAEAPLIQQVILDENKKNGEEKPAEIVGFFNLTAGEKKRVLMSIHSYNDLLSDVYPASDIPLLLGLEPKFDQEGDFQGIPRRPSDAVIEQLVRNPAAKQQERFNDALVAYFEASFAQPKSAEILTEMNGLSYWNSAIMTTKFAEQSRNKTSTESIKIALAAFTLPKNLNRTSKTPEDENLQEQWVRFLIDPRVEANHMAALYLAGKNLSSKEIAFFLRMKEPSVNYMFRDLLPAFLGMKDVRSIPAGLKRVSEFSSSLFNTIIEDAKPDNT